MLLPLGSKSYNLRFNADALQVTRSTLEARARSYQFLRNWISHPSGVIARHRFPKMLPSKVNPLFESKIEKTHKIIKNDAQNLDPWTSIYHSLIDFNGGVFLSTSKIKCQTTSRPERCPHPQILSVKSDYNPKEEKEKDRNLTSWF